MVRRAAADALGKIGDARAVGPLIAAMQAGRIVPQQVVSALEKIDPMWRDHKAVAPLVSSLIEQLNHSDPAVRWQAAETLGEIADESATQALIDAMMKRNIPVVAGAHPFFLRKGIRESEYRLVEALNTYGDESMANRFMRSGRPLLIKAAQKWARFKGIALISWPLERNYWLSRE